MIRSDKIRVLLADDSAFMRKVLHSIISADPEMEVVGEARDGEEAVAQVEALDPDVITMDLDMPRMDGLQATDAIMSFNPHPIVIVSTEARQGTEAAQKALELGALDFWMKPCSKVDLDMNNVRQELTNRLKLAARTPVMCTVPQVVTDSPAKCGVAFADSHSCAPASVRFGKTSGGTQFAATEHRASSAAKTPKLLLIETNVFFAASLGDALQKEGFEVLHSIPSPHAFTMLKWSMPSVVLCATHSGEVSAFRLPRILHGDARTAHISIVALGDGNHHTLMEAFRAGCDDYVDRDLPLDTIAAHVRSFLRSQETGLQMLSGMGAALTGSLAHLDLPAVIQMLGHSRQTGALHINADHSDGIIFFDRGELAHAESGDRTGDSAVVHIVRSCTGQDSGHYKFIPDVKSDTRTVRRSATELMLEALRGLDEERAMP